MIIYKTSKFFFLSCFLILITFLSAYAESVIVSGYGDNKQTALANAQRGAVEQGLGTLIDSKTVVSNFSVLQDKIISRAKGYITNYKILSEQKSKDGYNITIKADVSTASIKNDLRAIGILMSQIGNPRFMAIYMPETNKSAKNNSKVVKAVKAGIDEVFTKKSFIVLDPKFINDVYSEIKQAGNINVNLDKLSALALKYKADLLLVYDVQVSKKSGQSKYFGGNIVEMQLKAVSPATADLIAQKSGDMYLKTIKSSNKDSFNDVRVAKVADTLATGVSNAVINDILAYFERAVHAGTRFDVWFRNFTEDDTFTIIDAIEAMSGFVDKNIRNESPGNFQVDVNFKGKKFDFKRQLYKGLKKLGLRFKTQQSKGNRLLLMKK